jgi:hypothetical protein
VELEKAEFLDIILYSREQILIENKAMGIYEKNQLQLGWLFEFI